MRKIFWVVAFTLIGFINPAESYAQGLLRGRPVFSRPILRPRTRNPGFRRPGHFQNRPGNFQNRGFNRAGSDRNPRSNRFIGRSR